MKKEDIGKNKHIKFTIRIFNKSDIEKKIKQYDLQDNFIKTWDCIRDEEKKLKIDHRQISDCLNERQKTCHGYIWKYKEEEL